MLGKSYDAAHKLYQEVQKCEKYIKFISTNGTVHILPQEKLDKILTKHKQTIMDTLIERLEGEKRNRAFMTGEVRTATDYQHVGEQEGFNKALNTAISIIREELSK